MEIQPQLRDYMATEFRHIAKNISDEIRDLSAMVYYFSACHSSIGRVLNIEFNDELVFLFAVFNWCHISVANRVAMITQNTDRPVQLPPQFPEKLSGIIEEFAIRFEENRDVLDLLTSLVTLCYVVTGNGYFLYKTGRLKI